jgi:cardiolipin synthase
VLTLPNVISFTRILLVGLLWWLLVSGYAVWAAVLLILMASTDWLDGWLARRMNQVSDLGAVLDPVGDGLMMASAVLGGMIQSWVPMVVGVLLLIRSALVTGWSAWVVVVAKRTIAVRRSGKVAITLLFIAIPVFFFAAEASGVLRTWLVALAWITGAVGLMFYWWSGILYIRDAFSLTRETEG